MGLQQFSHVWILFIFHKNGHLSCKAKVQPPRLDGAKTGVFSTRSPHRPNAIGLTLAKLDKVEGDTVHLSGIDMIQGTPVLDIKPYIADYDSPQPTVSPKAYLQDMQEDGEDVSNAELQANHSAEDDDGPSMDTDDRSADKWDLPGIRCEILDNMEQEVVLETNEPSLVEDTCSLQGISSKQSLEDINTRKQSQDLSCDGTASFHETKDRPSSHRPSSRDSFVPKWVADSAVPSLSVRFTPHSERELRQFKPSCELGKPSFRFFRSFEEAKYAITKVLSADPRSVYRRNQCLDRLFYFSLDSIHITCWFGDGFAEVLKIQPVAEQPKT
ncbi:hypothetical protein GDO78_006791 [Eleutherodactylus coqui]|uniref:TsaA-like domain-containing protein n=1 Tax=Eleutherodactylus coqui TaxID=57060 RepID=A0A8J6KAB8_ELECQ|nr:hypothetical protein GDO78_006791 [Eleutherodactylus coqui]